MAAKVFILASSEDMYNVWSEYSEMGLAEKIRVSEGEAIE